ncbi:hypothetical protein QTN93_05470 [Sphingomonas aerolata]|uniref:hypothetical protein n=1 Tax=Sphingomonas aerolata TaxID=185951 RepID=UPI0035A7098B
MDQGPSGARDWHQRGERVDRAHVRISRIEVDDRRCIRCLQRGGHDIDSDALIRIGRKGDERGRTEREEPQRAFDAAVPVLGREYPDGGAPFSPSRSTFQPRSRRSA